MRFFLLLPAVASLVLSLPGAHNTTPNSALLFESNRDVDSAVSGIGTESSTLRNILELLVAGAISAVKFKDMTVERIKNISDVIDVVQKLNDAFDKGEVNPSLLPITTLKLLQNVLQSYELPTTPEEVLALYGQTTETLIEGKDVRYIVRLANLTMHGFGSNREDSVRDSWNQVNRPVPDSKSFYNKSPVNAPFSIAEEALRAAMYIPEGFTWGKGGIRQPILLAPGTGLTGYISYKNNIGKILSSEGFVDIVYLNVPGKMLADAQISAEYVAYALQYLHAMTDIKPAVITWSQGSLTTQWALKYWPSLRTVVTDFIAMSPDFHGTKKTFLMCGVLQTVEKLTCTPSIRQQDYDSRFIARLRENNGDSAYVPTTIIYSTTDNIVQPWTSARLNDFRHVGVSATAFKACQGQPGGGKHKHEIVLVHALTYALILDALRHDGPGKFSRVKEACKESYTPGLNSKDIGASLGLSIRATLNILTYLPVVTQEPDLKEYRSLTQEQSTLATHVVADILNYRSRKSKLPYSASVKGKGRIDVFCRGGSSCPSTATCYFNNCDLWLEASGQMMHCQKYYIRGQASLNRCIGSSFEDCEPTYTKVASDQRENEGLAIFCRGPCLCSDTESCFCTDCNLVVIEEGKVRLIRCEKFYTKGCPPESVGQYGCEFVNCYYAVAQKRVQHDSPPSMLKPGSIIHPPFPAFICRNECDVVGHENQRCGECVIHYMNTTYICDEIYLQQCGARKTCQLLPLQCQSYISNVDNSSNRQNQSTQQSLNIPSSVPLHGQVTSPQDAIVAGIASDKAGFFCYGGYYKFSFRRLFAQKCFLWNTNWDHCSFCEKIMAVDCFERNAPRPCTIIKHGICQNFRKGKSCIMFQSFSINPLNASTIRLVSRKEFTPPNMTLTNGNLDSIFDITMDQNETVTSPKSSGEAPATEFKSSFFLQALNLLKPQDMCDCHESTDNILCRIYCWIVHNIFGKHHGGGDGYGFVEAPFKVGINNRKMPGVFSKGFTLPGDIPYQGPLIKTSTHGVQLIDKIFGGAIVETDTPDPEDHYIADKDIEEDIKSFSHSYRERLCIVSETYPRKCVPYQTGYLPRNPHQLACHALCWQAHQELGAMFSRYLELLNCSYHGDGDDHHDKKRAASSAHASTKSSPSHNEHQTTMVHALIPPKHLSIFAVLHSFFRFTENFSRYNLYTYLHKHGLSEYVATIRPEWRQVFCSLKDVCPEGCVPHDHGYKPTTAKQHACYAICELWQRGTGLEPATPVLEELVCEKLEEEVREDYESDL